MELNSLNFDLKIEITGIVIGTKGESDVKLQFMRVIDGTVEHLDVKVVGTKKEDLARFLNKKVLIKNVEIFQNDFNKYYKTKDISNVEIIK